jgi:hypothetical protein
MRCFLILLTVIIVHLVPHDVSADVWEDSIVRDSQGKIIKRFIPVELFSGADWGGAHELTLASKVNTLQGKGREMRVWGPVKGHFDRDVIARKRNSKGLIYQEFEINRYADGMAMTYQERRGRTMARIVTHNKFPLGWWEPDESRRYCGQDRTQLTIIDLDQGWSNGIRFHWKIGSCGKECESIYVFTPGKGLTQYTPAADRNINVDSQKSVCDEEKDKAKVKDIGKLNKEYEDRVKNMMCSFDPENC